MPLIVCLFLLVGLFLWREQTRPELSYPVGKSEVLKPTEERRNGSLPPNKVDIEKTVQGVPPETAEKGLPVESSLDQERERPAQHEERVSGRRESSVTEESASQREAILNRLSESTVSRGERDSRLEESASPLEVSAPDASLFPEDAEETEPEPESETLEPEIVPPEPETAVLDDSLFPADDADVAPPPSFSAEPPPLNVEPPPSPAGVVERETLPTSQGEPYQIAEPDL